MEISRYSDVALGGYVAFHHEPTLREFTDAVNAVLAQIKTDSRRVAYVALSAAEVIYKTPERYLEEQLMSAGLFGSGPLHERVEAATPMWTVGVKARMTHFENGEPFNGVVTLLRPNGMAVPPPLMVIE